MCKSILEKKESPAVQAHINMSQGVINRMANNSANCKKWAVAILTALLALVADGKIGFSNLWICYIPTVLFFFLDCFYLGLERQLTKKQEELIEKINDGKDFEKDLFVVRPRTAKSFRQRVYAELKKFGKQFWRTIGGIISFSTLPFYGAMIVIIYFFCK